MKETAFPVPSVLNSNGDPIVGTRGMSLRDYFAAKAMQGFMQYSATKGINAPSDAELAQMSYDLADAMMKEREK